MEVERLLKDRGKEFESVALVHLDAVFRMAVALCGNGAEAEDMAQMTYLKAFERFGKFKRGSNCKAWLFKILRNSWIDHLRKKQVRGSEVGLDDVEVPEAANAEQMSWSDSEDMLENFSDEEVIRALQRLPGEQRMTLFLADVEQLDHERIGEIVGIAVGTVKSRTSRARRKLKEELLDYAKEMGYLRGEK
jgi:RNA polymerase sigma-70 factor (ECF subfamily)